MNFSNNAKKSTQAVARIIETSGGPIDYLRISKLIYLADKESIVKRGVPIVGGSYFSMRKGPVIGEVMDFVQRRNAPEWKETISPRFGNEVRLQGQPKSDSLSESELEILDSVVKFHLERTTDELVEWCHKNCPEYEMVQPTRRKPIAVESILKGVNKSQKQIQKFVQEAESLAKLDSMLS